MTHITPILSLSPGCDRAIYVRVTQTATWDWKEGTQDLVILLDNI
jgi:hypothetical protein